ncbi:hypothetical protein [Rubinisphaera italica]|nr:hypothetical protein [Rubinisphaera italica]
MDSETVPGKGWSVLLRLYGPEKSWFDKTWKPGEFELIEYLKFRLNHNR